MSLDVIIPRNISFVGCILIIAATESYKISRSFFIAQQWRRRCISSSISFNWHLVHIRWFFGVIGLLNRPLSIFRSCELIRYLAIAVMRWLPLMCKIYGSTQKYFFAQLTRTLNIFSPLLCKYSNNWFFKFKVFYKIYYKNNLFVFSIFCDSQVWSSPVCSRTEQIREHQLN